MIRRRLFAEVYVVSLLLVAGCSGMLGGGTRAIVPESSVPPGALIVFRQSHPNARIDRIEATFSNSPPFYRILYHEDGFKEAEAEFRYSDYGGLSNTLLPDRVRAAFRHAYPNGVIERVEWFEDVAKQAQYYRLTFHPAPPLEAFFGPDGQTIGGFGRTSN
jgi:hypothetical protein